MQPQRSARHVADRFIRRKAVKGPPFFTAATFTRLAERFLPLLKEATGFDWRIHGVSKSERKSVGTFDFGAKLGPADPHLPYVGDLIVSMSVPVVTRGYTPTGPLRPPQYDTRIDIERMFKSVISRQFHTENFDEIAPWVLGFKASAEETGLARRAAAPVGVKLREPQKRPMNKALDKAGLVSGNTPFPDERSVWAALNPVLSALNVSLSSVWSGPLFREDRGMRTLDIEFDNPEDAFSPIPILNSMLSISWYRRESGTYEVMVRFT